ncbi:MAG: YkgJ family cysteine cluster protein, partial [Brumimicrobium sp.]|nr:YkgJ family cysteine cluster protein [Brumimicrobium sp.]
MEYSSQLEKAVAQKKANKKFLKKLSKISTRELDSRFHEEHHAVFEKIDCLKCANCCKTTSPIFRDVDIDRLSRRLRISSSEFIDRYLIMDNEMDYVLKISPCTFLQEDSTCSVYEDRPLACKEYPHT